MNDKRPMFRILDDPIIKCIPWEAIAPHEKQAQANHSQSLRGLNGRGGLSVHEAYWVMMNKPLPTVCKRSDLSDAHYRFALMERLHRFEIMKAAR